MTGRLLRLDNEPEIDFALSFAKADKDIFASFPSELSFEHCFPFHQIEIDCSQILNDDFAKFAEKTKLEIINVRNISDRNLVENLCIENEKIKNAFIFGLLEKIAEIESVSIKTDIKISTFSFDFPVEKSYESAEFESNTIDLARRIATELYRQDKKLLINIRIPGATNIPLAYYNSFILKVSLPNVSLNLAVNPHEIAEKIEPASLLSPFKFTAHKLDLLYEPETGNHITKKLFDAWLTGISAAGFAGTIVFSPYASSNEIFFDDIRKLSQLFQA